MSVFFNTAFSFLSAPENGKGLYDWLLEMEVLLIIILNILIFLFSLLIYSCLFKRIITNIRDIYEPGSGTKHQIASDRQDQEFSNFKFAWKRFSQLFTHGTPWAVGVFVLSLLSGFYILSKGRFAFALPYCPVSLILAVWYLIIAFIVFPLLFSIVFILTFIWANPRKKSKSKPPKPSRRKGGK